MPLSAFRSAAHAGVCALAALVLGAVFAAGAAAQQGFSGRMNGPVAGPVELVAVVPGGPLQQKSFDYGSASVDGLLEDLRDEMRRALHQTGLAHNRGAAYQLRVVLVDARPNRPTVTQLGREPGLSPQSLYRGGARIEATVFAPNGAEIGRFAYQFETRDIRDSAYSATWTDARHAMRSFSERLARRLSDAQNERRR